MKMKVTQALLSFMICSFSTVLIAESKQYPFLGIAFSPVREKIINGTSHSGVLVDQIIPRSSAASSNLKINDFIVMYDLKTFPTSNIGTTFKAHIKQQSIGDTIKLKVFRQSLTISKDINNELIPVNFSIQDVANDVEQMKDNNNLTFNFSKSNSIHDFVITLGSRPFMLLTTPNQSLGFSNKPDYFLPQLNNFFDNIHARTTDLKLLKDKQVANEFWDNGFRLSSVRYLHTNPEKLAAFNQFMKQRLLKDDQNSLFMLAQQLADIDGLEATTVNYPNSKNFSDHIKFIKEIINISSTHYNNSLKALNEDEKETLKELTTHINQHIKRSLKDESKRINISEDLLDQLDIIKKIDFEELAKGQQLLLSLNNPFWLNKFKAIAKEEPTKMAIDGSVKGPIHYEEKLKQGHLIIASSKHNQYPTNIAFIIDLGGDDLYKNNAGGNNGTYKLSFCIDIEGNDLYSSTSPFSQGSAFLGYGLLVDLTGDDNYKGLDFSQASAVLGHASLIDHEGDDSYQANSFSQSSSIFGSSLLMDENGDDYYHGNFFTQSAALTKGIAFLIDKKGNDFYNARGNKQSTYGTPGIFSAFSQGFAFGLRNISSGGIALLHDKEGDDHYQAGNFALGTGYFYGLGLFSDTAGDDHYLSSRYSLGSSAHSAIGIFYDRSGDDEYSNVFGSSAGIAWDYSNAYFLDENGNDKYNFMHSKFVLGQADHNSFAFFHDKNGKDSYQNNHKKSAASNSYNGGKSIAIFLDEGSDKDDYSSFYLNDNSSNPVESFFFFDK